MSNKHIEKEKKILEQKQKKVIKGSKKVKKLQWREYEGPDRLMHFFYDKKIFFIVLLASLIVFFAFPNQPMEIKSTLAVFVFAAGSWMFNVFPLAITGLLIPIALTLLGVFSPEESFAPFAHPVIFLMIGGLVLGQAIRKHGLDKWVAYNMLVWSKGRISIFVFLFIMVTAFLSMWMSNVIAVAVLLPVAITLITSLPKSFVNLRNKVLLGMIIAAPLGGMAMLTGSTPAMIGAAVLGDYVSFGFLHWAYYGIPISLVSLLIVFIVLKIMFPSHKHKLDVDIIKRQKQKAGPLRRAQKEIMIILLFTIMLWFLGSQIEVWLGLPASISSAAIVSILSVLVMFGLDLLNLKDVTSVKWDIIFLIGGGILLGEAMIVSGIATKIGLFLASLQGAVPLIVIIFMFALLSLILTNFVSNTATAAMLAPVAVETSIVLGINPIPLVMAVALTAAIAFITPVGTPSTAMVIGTGLLSRKKLIRAGLIIGTLVMVVAVAAVYYLPVPTFLS